MALLTEEEKRDLLNLRMPRKEDDKNWYFLGLKVPKNKHTIIYSYSGKTYHGIIVDIGESHIYLLSEGYGVNNKVAIDLSRIEAIEQPL